jgi:hypothetical protein
MPLSRPRIDIEIIFFPFPLMPGEEIKPQPHPFFPVYDDLLPRVLVGKGPPLSPILLSHSQSFLVVVKRDFFTLHTRTKRKKERKKYEIETGLYFISTNNNDHDDNNDSNGNKHGPFNWIYEREARD